MAGAQHDAEFTEYVAARTAWLRRTAYLLCQDWHRADDLTQAAFLRLYVHWERALKVEHLDAYVRTILVNTFLNEQRSPWWKRITLTHGRAGGEEFPVLTNAQARSHLGARSETAPGYAAAPQDASEDSLDLLAALAELPPRQRAALVLRYYCDLSITDTAHLLGCTPGTVKSQTSRGLDALRRVLEVRPTA
ncbi:SigE family RNA polymerase sigma factor [Actinospica sp. MGRD01-02]|uniref:SigE family RNA polymerase sigma factor n=1 Tax=Actinospica acidithermotolerans TaxID=2828514 RepID=A0A941E8H3_9ACTN|nr:SigE family RNA polymerase sigma factor [Actinospica acidithermotolerans]MBR7826951.1 SigE family RNA polymerase sigma factor [Actinospica acidithermotolerans]